jgi:tRNA splicing ligase
MKNKAKCNDIMDSYPKKFVCYDIDDVAPYIESLRDDIADIDTIANLNCVSRIMNKISRSCKSKTLKPTIHSLKGEINEAIAQRKMELK